MKLVIDFRRVHKIIFIKLMIRNTVYIHGTSLSPKFYA